MKSLLSSMLMILSMSSFAATNVDKTQPSYPEMEVYVATCMVELTSDDEYAVYTEALDSNKQRNERQEKDDAQKVIGILERLLRPCNQSGVVDVANQQVFHRLIELYSGMMNIKMTIQQNPNFHNL